MVNQNIYKIFCTAILSVLFINTQAQTMMPLPSHSTTYSGAVRGYWFTAPVDFTIVGLRVASEAGSGSQSIQVIKIHDNPPVVYGTTSTNFTSLFYVNGATNGVIQQVNIQISAGDRIGIYGQAGTTNSYGNPPSTTNLAGYSVSLKRSGYQGNINSSSMPNYWTQTSGSISRVEMYYETCDADVTSQPQPKTVCEDENVQFDISATLSGGAGAYRWQVDEGNGFFDIANGGAYSNATTNTLDITNAPYSLNGYEYRCIAEVGTCADTSDAVGLNVNGLVKIEDLNPKDTTCIDATKSLEVKGTGSITNYRWQIYNSVSGTYVDVPNSAPYVQQGNILNINGVPDTLNGARFRVVVDGVCDNAISSPTTLTVNQLPQVVVPPVDVNAQHGQDVMFEVQASGKAIYRWQVAAPDTFVNINDGGIYSGARTNRLRVFGVSRVQDNFKFRCVVETDGSCIAPGDTSNFAILYVEPPASVNTISGDASVQIYPNPAGDVLHIKSSVAFVAGMKYTVLDKTGRTVLNGVMNDASDTQIDVAKLPADIYMLRITDKNDKLYAVDKFTKL